MNKEELIQRCLIDDDATETYPFADSRYKGTPILRHKSNNKWFGVVFEQEKVLYINLKAHPEEISILKDQFPKAILPAWHMNKRHWYKVDVNSISTELLDRLIKISFEITRQKKKAHLMGFFLLSYLIYTFCLSLLHIFQRLYYVLPFV